MSSQETTPPRRVRIGGVFRCCLDHPYVDKQQGDEGAVLPCKHCDDGLRLVRRDDGLHWEAAWITLGNEWRKEPQG